MSILTWVFFCSYFVRLSDGLVPGGTNVCSKLRLSKVVDVFQSNWATEWDCEASYPHLSCDLIRSGEVSISSVYFLQESLTCCAGWTQSEDGPSCHQACQAGYFGENCAFKCRCFSSANPSDCDVIDGTCDCLEGWKGRGCDERCSPGQYGPGCSSSGVICENGGTTHPVTGECLCRAGFDGLACDLLCNKPGTECGQIRCESCIASNRKDCDPLFNACTCKNGWQGRYCTDLCPRGFEGHFCKDECCSQQGACFDGGCLCNDGYYGDECQKKCPAGTFGRNCTGECACPSCDHVTGACSSCPAGFKGISCTERCSPSEWGLNCTSNCSCGSTGACDVFTGQCVKGDDIILIIIIITLASSLLVVLFCACVICSRHYFNKNRTEPRTVLENTVTDAATNNTSSIDEHLTGQERGEIRTSYQSSIHQSDRNSCRELPSNIEHHYYEDMEDVPAPLSRCTRPHTPNCSNLHGETEISAHINPPQQYARAIYFQHGKQTP